MRSQRFLRSTVLAIFISLLVTACQSGDPRRTPVSEIGQEARGAYHRVQRGDTLYSIAWRYGLDYKALADLNGISPPYTIYVDQKIRLFGGERGGTRSEAIEQDGPPTGSGRPAPAEQATTVTKSVAGVNSVQDNREIRWRWPLEGEVIGEFSLAGDVNKGLNIRGKPRDQVRAAGDGVVVYAGGGLRGYGKLVIVKHNARYLSAYAHNRKLLVTEGDSVKAGEVIARIGGNDPDAHILHFEIRRDGKPRDPLAYLPAR